VQWVRSLLKVVPQDRVLFNDTIRYSIRYVSLNLWVVLRMVPHWIFFACM
jgi:ABC-type transport system involved in Fe-S cluster assembly fused permease/ATPase subunit